MNARPRDPAERETQWTLLYLWPLLHRRSSRQNCELMVVFSSSSSSFGRALCLCLQKEGIKRA
jgi:hypothetical protein